MMMISCFYIELIEKKNQSSKLAYNATWRVIVNHELCVTRKSVRTVFLKDIVFFQPGHQPEHRVSSRGPCPSGPGVAPRMDVERHCSRHPRFTVRAYFLAHNAH